MRVFGFVLFLVIVLGIVFLFWQPPAALNEFTQQVHNEDQLAAQQLSPEVEVVAQNLEIPWAVAFLPDGNMLVTERPGRVQRVTQAGAVELVAQVEGVLHIGEGGLLGLALHPDFGENNWIYLYLTYSSNGNNTLNRVVRYSYAATGLSERRVIIDEIPGARNHNGGRIAFGPDGYLYITTGDAGEPSLSQDTESLAGKILRVTDTGEPAPGNPFGTEVYSYGHRNPQGLTWRDGELWATEHGPRAQDELNLVQAGQNYGWPQITGTQERAGMRSPVIQSGDETWAPSGLAYHKGVFFFAGLRGSTLFSFDPENPDVGVSEQFAGEFGRLRDVVVGPDGALYLATSNRDGRGSPAQNDDRIIRVR